MTAPREVAMPKAFAPQEVEGRLYKFWEENGFFTPKIDPNKEPFTIIMPPPNVTGELHLGHAVTASLEDAMIRWHRMRGDPTLWLPGSDHSGIAAQVMVERSLAEEGLDRHKLGREKFLERMWDWTRKYGHAITEQHKRLGASADWTRERFTLDPGPSKAVRTNFVRLYHKGLIYRGERIINWCPRCSTVLSDLEIDHHDVKSHLWYVRYPIVDPSGPDDAYITVATTRPETILGDTAVAVNPADERYTGMIGKKAILPVIGREIPIVADEAVDPAFGTGAVKVTPAHDPVDFEIGQRHNLPAVNVMNLDMTMNENAGPYVGLDCFVTRQALVADLERLGLLVEVKDYEHSVGHCSRCKSVVEPIISPQWYINIKPLAKPAIEAVEDGRIRIVPDRFAKVYVNWMENIRDWCISRQLWWGHRIPVWYCQDCEGLAVPPLEDPMRDPTECPACHSSNLKQDEDVLDTWFSSGLWPISTLGWPDDTEDLRYFYPTSVMETGYDILFFWVARMIMFGLENTGQVPFRTVYLHGLVRDEKGEKMSKTKGNVINPLEVMARYGTDALRFTLTTGNTPGNDMRLSQEKLEGGRNFANKIWNAARFILGEMARTSEPLRPVGDPSALPLEDRWILSRTNRLIDEVNRLFDDFQFGEAARLIYEFLWGEFCDWYIEIAKVRLRQPKAGEPSPLPVLVDVLDKGLRLLHPFMPFVTEEVWQNLMVEGGGSAVRPEALSVSNPPALIVQPWPTGGPTDEEAEETLETLIGIVRGVRNARVEYGVEAARYVEATIQAGELYDFLSDRRAVLETLARLRPLHVERELAEKPKQAVALIVGPVETYLPLAGLVDLAQERERLRKELEGLVKQIDGLRGRLANAAFIAKAPPAVVEKERERLAAAEERKAKIEERLATLAG